MPRSVRLGPLEPETRTAHLLSSGGAPPTLHPPLVAFLEALIFKVCAYVSRTLGPGSWNGLGSPDVTRHLISESRGLLCATNSIDFDLIVTDAAFGSFSDESQLSVKEERQGRREALLFQSTVIRLIVSSKQHHQCGENQ